MNEYNQNLKSFYESLEPAMEMVLATAKDNRVTARMMSCLFIDDSFYFQTDKKLLKYVQMMGNPSVALCKDNIQIEGTAIPLGHPLDEQNNSFIVAYEKSYRGSLNTYSAIADEVVIRVTPSKITLWEYENGHPYREFFDIGDGKYAKEFYIG